MEGLPRGAGRRLDSGGSLEQPLVDPLLAGSRGCSRLLVATAVLTPRPSLGHTLVTVAAAVDGAPERPRAALLCPLPHVEPHEWPHVEPGCGSYPPPHQRGLSGAPLMTRTHVDCCLNRFLVEFVMLCRQSI